MMMPMFNTEVPSTLAPCQLDLTPLVQLSEKITVPLRAANANIETLQSFDDLAALFRRETKLAVSTQQQWACHPKMRWIQTLVDELGPSDRAHLIELQDKVKGRQAEGIQARWALTSDVASTAVSLWLEKKKLEEVIKMSKTLGHDKLRSGTVLTGSFVECLAAKRGVSLKELLPWVEQLAPKTVSLYRTIPENAFQTEARTEATLEELGAELRQRLVSGVGGCGSLDTTFEFGKEERGKEEEEKTQRSALLQPSTSGVPLLDTYWNALREHSDAFSKRLVQLNHRLYLIWKLTGYCTPYHQDTHIPPHFTLYNQVSGVSTFHFLPLLVGLYAAQVGRRQGPNALRELLRELEGRGIGELATVGEGQMLLILPFASHGVFVPRGSGGSPAAGAAVSASASSSSSSSRARDPMPRFDVSLIRAAELYISPIYETFRKLLRDERWDEAVTLTENKSMRTKSMLRRPAGRVQKLKCFKTGRNRVFCPCKNVLCGEGLCKRTGKQRQFCICGAANCGRSICPITKIRRPVCKCGAEKCGASLCPDRMVARYFCPCPNARCGRGLHRMAEKSKPAKSSSAASLCKSKRLKGELRCRCGSTTHLRKSHRDCPLNPANAAAASSNPAKKKRAESSSVASSSESKRSMKRLLRCRCGSTTHLRKSHRDCPLNPANAAARKRARASKKKPTVSTRSPAALLAIKARDPDAGVALADSGKAVSSAAKEEASGLWARSLVGRSFEDTQDGTRWTVRDVYLRDASDDCEEEAYEGWVVEYYPAASASADPGGNGTGVEWSPVDWLMGNGPCGEFVRWL